MPIYEYRCRSCGHTLDALQKLADPPLTDCPECAQPALKRLISAPAFRLKGGGWYETDFKSDKEKKRNLAESGKKDDSAPSAESAKSADAAKSSDPKKSSDSKKSSEPKKSDAGKSTTASKDSSSGGSSTAAA